MYVCLSVTGLRLNIRAYALFTYLLACSSGCHHEDSEDRRRVQMYGRRLTAQQKMKDKITVTRNDLRVTTRAIYFTR